MPGDSIITLESLVPLTAIVVPPARHGPVRKLKLEQPMRSSGRRLMSSGLHMSHGSPEHLGRVVGCRRQSASETRPRLFPVPANWNAAGSSPETRPIPSAMALKRFKWVIYSRGRSARSKASAIRQRAKMRGFGPKMHAMGGI